MLEPYDYYIDEKVERDLGLNPMLAIWFVEKPNYPHLEEYRQHLRDLKENNIWIFGAAGEAEKSLYQADLTVPTALVLGAEGRGMRRLTREHCDDLLHIPMQGTVSSLNVSVAAGVFLFEVVRQRGSLF